MFKLRTETDPIRKSMLSKSLSEILLRPNGFVSYFEYISSVTDDNIVCMELFCKVVLARPSKFSGDMVAKN
jgi:hypothetical protein